ncbi:sulfite exporter TauE/SafE family protein [Candidatus Uhrbacteria bacterium]|nr:sulfite exporter TauE/SafE family protein [Candidatus Uhrbacteria bacterium]
MNTKKQCNELVVAIDGMTCKSCEVLIEKKLQAIGGITHISVNTDKGTARICYLEKMPTIKDLQSVFGDTQYSAVRFLDRREQKTYRKVEHTRAPIRISRIFGAFAFAFFVSALFTKAGLLKGAAVVPESLQFGAAFILGLVAATSSCVATVGGLLVSSLSAYQRNHPVSSLKERILPVASFMFGRLLSYGLLGGIIGLLGSALTPSPILTGGIVIVAALYMIAMGMSMLGISVPFANRFMPKMPKRIARRVTATNSPFFMGIATFFVPCGFTQSLQLYALTTGSFLASASLLFAFALGTTPVLTLIGFSFNVIRGKVREIIFQFSGALIILMGVGNIQNGFTIAGHPLDFSWVKGAISVNAGQGGGSAGSFVEYDGKEQTALMSVRNYGYVPDRFTLRAGVPTRWLIEAQSAGGCLGVLQAPTLGIGPTVLRKGENEISFIPQQLGTHTFSCSMGMFRGTITVVPNT